MFVTFLHKISHILDAIFFKKTERDRARACVCERAIERV